MVNNDEVIKQLKDRLNKLENQHSGRADFSDRVVYMKTVEIIGTGKLKLRNLPSNPLQGNIGEIVCVGGKLKICTAISPAVWSIVGTQS